MTLDVTQSYCLTTFCHQLCYHTGGGVEEEEEGKMKKKSF
jgi:hypothetical protein